MNNKILVIVYVPLIEKEFDILIPTVKKVGTVKNLIIKIVEENTDGVFSDNNSRYLYDKVSGNLIDDNLFVRDSNLKNGTKVILY